MAVQPNHQLLLNAQQFDFRRFPNDQDILQEHIPENMTSQTRQRPTPILPGRYLHPMAINNHHPALIFDSDRYREPDGSTNLYASAPFLEQHVPGHRESYVHTADANPVGRSDREQPGRVSTIQTSQPQAFQDCSGEQSVTGAVVTYVIDGDRNVLVGATIPEKKKTGTSPTHSSGGEKCESQLSRSVPRNCLRLSKTSRRVTKYKARGRPSNDYRAQALEALENKKDVEAVEDESSEVVKHDLIQSGEMLKPTDKQKKKSSSRQASERESSYNKERVVKKVRSGNIELPGRSRYWTPTEHKLFIKAIEKYGPRNLRYIAATVETRSMTQCRTHAQKCFMRLLREAHRETITRSEYQAMYHEFTKRPPQTKEMYSISPICGLSLLSVVAEELTFVNDIKNDRSDC